MIHRLHRPGRPIQMAPPPMLEGVFAGSPPTFTTCPRLDREIQALHILARSGAIPPDTAERQLNSYLLAAGLRVPGLSPALLVLPIADAPHYSLLPDLGQVTHSILAQNPHPSSLSAVLEQCLPAWRHSSRPISYEDSQDVLLNIIMALVLGLYPGATVKRPRFEARAQLFARLHGMLTSTQEQKTSFCRQHPALLLLACMEYVARVLPANMPSQHAFILEREPSCAVYFRRIPALGDDLREELDHPHAPPWDRIQSSAAAMVERVTRLKKTGPTHTQRSNPQSTDPSKTHPGADLASYWRVPRLQGVPTADEFRILGLGLRLQGSVLQDIQREVQVRRCTATTPAPAEKLLSTRCSRYPATCARYSWRP